MSCVGRQMTDQEKKPKLCRGWMLRDVNPKCDHDENEGVTNFSVTVGGPAAQQTVMGLLATMPMQLPSPQASAGTRDPAYQASQAACRVCNVSARLLCVAPGALRSVLPRPHLLLPL